MRLFWMHCWWETVLSRTLWYIKKQITCRFSSRSRKQNRRNGWNAGCRKNAIKTKWRMFSRASQETVKRFRQESCSIIILYWLASWEPERAPFPIISKPCLPWISSRWIRSSQSVPVWASPIFSRLTANSISVTARRIFWSKCSREQTLSFRAAAELRCVSATL